MLELRGARICSFDCTFCASCANGAPGRFGPRTAKR
jgi:hypothetical protein